jgi:hypothetical protein
MKFQSILLSFGVMAGAILLLSNSGGRAAAGGAGSTGAPGETTTCSGCHSGGTAPTVTLALLDASNTAVTSYVPGANYTVRFNISSTATGFAFQMLGLLDNGNVDPKGFSDVGTNNYQLSTLTSRNRTYAEHDGVATAGTFNVTWKAPVAGSGALTFYAVGNAVNRNGNTSGDGVAATTLKLTESGTISTKESENQAIGLKILANPVQDLATVSVRLERGGNYRLLVRDLNGRALWQENRTLAVGEQTIEIEAADWQPGVYFVELHGEGARAGQKLMKL